MTETRNQNDDEQLTTTRRRTLAALGALPVGGGVATGVAAGESPDENANPGVDHPDIDIPYDEMQPRVEVAVPEHVFQTARARADAKADGAPSGEAIDKILLDYVTLQFRWVRASTGEVIHED